MITIKAIAKHAGVSVTTVSHALNRPERVTPALRARVEQAVAELGYIPNPHARNLRTGRTHLIALLIPDICNPFFPELARAIQDLVAQAGFDLLIYNTDVPGGMASRYAANYFDQLNPKRFDGAIIAAEAAVGAGAAWLKSLAVPTVYIGHLDEPILDSVRMDDFAAAYDATRYLIERGHRRIGHIAGEPAFFPGRERRRAFEQALRDHGLPVDAQLIYSGTFLRPAGRAGMQQLLALHKPPTAVFVANALMGLAALGTALDLGRRVPEDIALLSIDNIAEMQDVRPTLTTIDASSRVLGERAVDLLLSRIHGDPAAPVRSEVVPHTLIPGKSV